MLDSCATLLPHIAKKYGAYTALAIWSLLVKVFHLTLTYIHLMFTPNTKQVVSSLNAKGFTYGEQFLQGCVLSINESCQGYA
jgi:hypothetical protein